MAHQDRLRDLTRLRSRSGYLPLGSEFLQPVRNSTGEACISFSRCERSIKESCLITLLTLQTDARRSKSEEKKKQRDQQSHTSSGIVAAAEIREHGDQRHHQQDTRHPSPPPAAAQLLHGRRRNSPRTDTGTGVRAPIVERPHAFSSSCKDSERSRKGSDDWVAWQSWRWRRKQWW